MKHTLEQIHLHGFDLSLLRNLDSFQTTQLLCSYLNLFSNVQYPESYSFSEKINLLFDSVHNIYEVQNLIDNALVTQTNLLDALNDCNHPTLDGTLPKHNLSKPVTKESGSTSAILSNMKCFFFPVILFVFLRLLP